MMIGTQATDLPLIQVRPKTLWAVQGYSILATDLDGMIGQEPNEVRGFYYRNTRYLSRYQWRINGQALTSVCVQPAAFHTLLGYYRNPVSGDIPENALDINITRMVGNGIHEDVTLTNIAKQPVTFQLMLQTESDFLDSMADPAHNEQPPGESSRYWHADQQRFELTYQLEQIHHGLIMDFDAVDEATWDTGSITWEIKLEAKASWHCCNHISPIFCQTRMDPIYNCLVLGMHRSARDRLQQQWFDSATRMECSNPIVQRAYDSSKSDLIMMRLWEEDRADDAWIPAAGLPQYIGVFGRDILTAGWQAGLLGPEMMHGAVEVLRDTQATETDDWRDEQPGKMIHEIRYGPMSLLNIIPQSRYYGSTTSTPLFIIVLSELYHWTGNRRLIEENQDALEKALAWIDRYGDFDGDGFYEYQKLSPRGLKNQGWKDSDEGIMYADGTLVPNPIATCEEQAWVYDAKVRAALLFAALKDFKKAERYLEEAYLLKARFNRAYWMPDLNYYALALDPDKRQVTSITSNPGHCLATGIIEDSKAGPTIGRLISPDLFSGWGIRTLSSNHINYDPYGYHLGTVWPVENGTFCMGFTRYGYHKHAQMLAEAMFETSRYFIYGRLPEALGGQPKSAEHPFPTIYPNANMPQAWSSSIVPIMIQSLLGLYPFAPLRTLMLDPHLPSWLPQLTLNNLRVGDARLSIRFWRDRHGKTHYDLLDRQGECRILPRVFNPHHFHDVVNLVESRLSKL